jgi:SAM-dependent methyltransferase
MEMLPSQAGLAVGIDPDLLSLRELRAQALPRACGLAGCLPFSDEAFDLICCSWVLEHLPDPEGAFREVARVLAPGGRFVFVTPNRRHPLLALNRVLHWTSGALVDRLYGREAEDTFPAFYRANTRKQIDHWAGRAGLRPVAFHHVGDPTYLAFNDLFYRLACWVERFLPPALRVHLVGDYVLG